MTENELKHYVLRVARMNGWMVKDSSQSRIVRPVKGESSGWPDLALVRDGELLFMELKTDDGMLSPDQYRWQIGLHPRYHVIRPRDLDAGRLVELLG